MDSTAKLSRRSGIYSATQRVLEARAEWYRLITTDPGFVDRKGIVYPYDTISANIDPMFGLFEQSGFIDNLESGNIETVCDVGCANGELSFSFAQAGYDVVAIDYSFKHDQAPFIVKRIAEMESYRVAVVDKSVDCCFDFKSLRDACINDRQELFPKGGRFDLVVCVGLLYHLRNPFAFLESIARISRYAVIGTHIFTHTPGLRVCVSDASVAYLVDAAELNNDPTNYWIFSQIALSRLVQRSGFSIRGSLLLPNNPLNVAVPDRTDLGVRNLLMLESII
jgi:SAM-dependent methyltransferase